MSRRRRQIEGLLIEDVSSQGFGIGRHNGKVIFVENAIPGDLVDVKVRQSKKDFSKAFAYNFQKLSEERQDPFCSHFAHCGGCKWQYLSYKKQLSFKQGIVENAFRNWIREGLEVKDILPAPEQTHYRNKLEYSFSNKAWRVGDEDGPSNGALGFHPPRYFDKVVDVHNCYLQNDLGNAIRNFCRDFCFRENLSFYDARAHEGLMRTLILRNNRKGDWMLILSISQEEVRIRKNFFSSLEEAFPQIVSAYLVINPKKNDSMIDLPCEKIFGQDCIEMQLENLKFELAPKSFFQTNTKQAENLYALVFEFAQLEAHQTCLDLYCGIGTMSLFAAGRCREVLGIEIVPQAIADAQRSAELNNVKNVQFKLGDIKDLLDAQQKFDLVIVDPPRAGLHPQVVENLNRLQCQRLVYVSCNPATQARDIAILNRFALKKIQAVDMFPHTKHIENVALLEPLPA